MATSYFHGNSAQVLFLFDVSSSVVALHLDKSTFISTLQSVILQISFIIKSSLIGIIAKTVDLRSIPPILRYRSKSFHPIHSDAADLEKLHSYLLSMVPKHQTDTPESSSYSWEIVKLYLLQALSDYPWNISSETDFKAVFLFTSCFKALSGAGPISALLQTFASHGVNLICVSETNIQCEPISATTLASLNDIPLPFINTNCCNIIKQLIRDHRKKTKVANMAFVNDELQDPCLQKTASGCSMDICRMTFNSLDTTGGGSDNLFSIFLYFYYLTSDLSADDIFSQLHSEFRFDSSLFAITREFFMFSFDVHSCMLEILKSAAPNTAKLAAVISNELFSAITPYLCFFHARPIVRSAWLLKIIFLSSPIGHYLFSNATSCLYSQLNELVVSFLISDAIMNHSSRKTDIELLQRVLNSSNQKWHKKELSQIKEMLDELFLSSNEECLSSDHDGLSSPLLHIENSLGDHCSDTSSSQLHAFPMNCSRSFFQTQSSLTSVETCSPSPLFVPPVSCAILVEETPTKHYMEAQTPKQLSDDEHNIIIAETPKKFISCKRTLQY